MHYLLVTSNEKKADEFRSAFGLYGKKVEVISAPPESLSVEVLEAHAKGAGVVAVLTEHSWLAADPEGTVVVDEPYDMQVVHHFSRLKVKSLDGSGNVRDSEYGASVRGFFNLDLKRHWEDVFGWDDGFVPTSADADFHSLKARGLKNSARQVAIGKFIVDTLTYESRLDLNFNRQNMDTTVEFEGRVAEFVDGNALVRNAIEGSFLDGMVARVIDTGVFFRSAGNRREKNYWLPGLNAGIPLTAKKDEIHEVTFFFHDLMHFQIPDLVYDGTSECVEDRDAYVLYRMMSEAFTLVFADMYFVDGLVRAGVDYDFSKRRIYPLFRHLKRSEVIVEDMRAILRASSLFAVNADDSGFEALLDGSPEGYIALAEFKSKYGRFFSEDLVWTRRNLETMESQSDYLRRWMEIVGRGTVTDNGLTILGDFASRVRSRRGDITLDTVFEEMFETMIVPGIGYARRQDVAETVSRAFKRYMLGQMSIFARYGEICPMPTIMNKLRHKLVSSGVLSDSEISAMRTLYTVYVAELRRRDLVSDDDARVFASIHPLFPPNYVFYDAKT